MKDHLVLVSHIAAAVASLVVQSTVATGQERAGERINYADAIGLDRFPGTDAERAELARSGFVITSESLRQFFSAYGSDENSPFS